MRYFLALSVLFAAGVLSGAEVSAAEGASPEKVMALWKSIVDHPEDGKGKAAAEDIFLLLAIDLLADSGAVFPPGADRKTVLTMLDDHVLALPGGREISDDDITDFYYENQTIFLEDSGSGDFLIVDLERFPDAVDEVSGRLAQGEPLKKISADFSLPEKDMDGLLMRDEVQTMLLRCRQLPPPSEPAFMQQGKCVLWYQMKITRRFLPLDDILRKRIKVMLKAESLGGWENIFGKKDIQREYRGIL